MLLPYSILQIWFITADCSLRRAPTGVLQLLWKNLTDLVQAQQAAPHSVALENLHEIQSSQKAQLPCMKTVQLQGTWDRQLILFFKTASQFYLKPGCACSHTYGSIHGNEAQCGGFEFSGGFPIN